MKVLKCLLSWPVTVALIVTASLMLAAEGTWSLELFHHWTFVAIVLLALPVLLFAALSNLKKKSYCPLISHLGLFLVLTGGLFSATNRIETQMRVFQGELPEHLAFYANHTVVPLPFDIALEEFKTDYYEDGCSPKQFTSTLRIDGKTLQTSVNRPCTYKGYRIYQCGYDALDGRYSDLKIVRDPWLPAVALGALLLAIAAVLSLKKAWHSWKVLPAAVVLAAVFTVISVARIEFVTLPPALRSLWFAPHLIIYMLAYSLMALSVISGVGSLFFKKIPELLSQKLLSTSSALLLAGMLCGAVWAQQAWGNYWTWDAKECWAAVTWLLTLAAQHIPGNKNKLIFTVLAFVAIQITWYGVNYLPAASGSLHTYN